MNFKKIIEERGIKQSWVADKIGVSHPMISMFLNGERSLSKENEEKLKNLLT